MAELATIARPYAEALFKTAADPIVHSLGGGAAITLEREFDVLGRYRLTVMELIPSRKTKA